MMGEPHLIAAPDSLRIVWPDGVTRDFPSVWLRDNVAELRDARNGQRLIDVADLPAAPRIRRAELRADRVRILWDEEDLECEFPLPWLAAAAQSSGMRQPERIARVWRDAQQLKARDDFAWLKFAGLKGDSLEKWRWLSALLQTGMAFIEAMPEGASGILDAVSEIGQVSETNYGVVFEVRSVPHPENLAFSDLGLQLHTDNPYREPVPGFQALHALVASAEGGRSIFADGFALAAQLKVEAPREFELLSSIAVPFHYRSKDADLYAERPLIQLDCRGEVRAVHYNNRSIAPLPPEAPLTRDFYAAYRRFAQLLRDPRFQLHYHMAAGEMVVFDNQRILHGRTAFTSARQERHLRGCYLTRDSVYSKAALLRGRYSA
jgi:gamma-butyrobetaine dioxygenase